MNDFFRPSRSASWEADQPSLSYKYLSAPVLKNIFDGIEVPAVGGNLHQGT